MPASKGLHWSFDGEVLDIFGAKGQIIGQQAYLGYPSSDLVATPLLDIKQQIESSLTSGYPGIARIGYIVMDEFNALQLFFEGALTIEALKAATEDVDSITVQVQFGERSYNCVIRTSPRHSLQFFRTDGETVNTQRMSGPCFSRNARQIP